MKRAQWTYAQLDDPAAMEWVKSMGGGKYHIVTYGCQMNERDSQTLAGILEKMGYECTEDKADADIILFNTCCVRENAERRVFGNVAWLKALKKEKPNLILGVCGCMMQQPGMAEKFLKRHTFVDIVFGTHATHRFPKILRDALLKKRVMDVEDEAHIVEDMPVYRPNVLQAYVTIMYGCNNFCSFCIVPYVRGRERSRRAEDICHEIEGLLEEGVQEITLLGQNVNSYRDTQWGEDAFARLLEKVDGLGVPRIRFMTSHPKDINPAVLEAMAGGKHIAHQLHLPVQSGSDAILKEMNRQYTVEHYLEKVALARRLMPDIGLTTDLIVGFPGETEGDFEKTLELVDAVGYDAAFTFEYSAREGTRAAAMTNHVADDIKQARIMRLIQLQQQKSEAIHRTFVGSNQQVLITNVSKRDAKDVTGKNERGTTINCAGDESLIGTIQTVHVTRAGRNTLRGELIRTENGEENQHGN